jgi:RHS repeat-associated protein
VTYYELSNHLGNVLVTVTDMKIGIEGGTNWVAEYYEATVVSANDYYPFGSAMAGRKYNDDSYRYGFNGMEKDDEVKGNGNSYDFGARLYDSRIGKWLALDPLAAKFPEWSAYNYVLDNPVMFIDPDGKAPKGVLPIDMNFEFASSQRPGAGQGNYAMRALNNTKAWNTTLDNFRGDGVYSNIDLGIKSMTVMQAKKTNSARIPVLGMTNISVMVEGKSILLQNYSGNGTDISCYTINVSVLEVLGPEMTITTLTHEVGTHALSYAAKIAAVQNGTTSFGQFLTEYKGGTTLANNNPLYMSADHVLLSQGGSAAYKAIKEGVIKTVDADFFGDATDTGLQHITVERSDGEVESRNTKRDKDGKRNEKGTYRHKSTTEVLEEAFDGDKNIGG